MKEYKAYHRPAASFLADPDLKAPEDCRARYLLITFS